MIPERRALLLHENGQCQQTLFDEGMDWSARGVLLVSVSTLHAVSSA